MVKDLESKGYYNIWEQVCWKQLYNLHQFYFKNLNLIKLIIVDARFSVG
jgi:hypothetical protein